ncbi:MAG TPA: carboxylesterase family protein [Sphingomonas sp.]|nr:carboxylesterase family protein [Sphingomonas sp.]
MRSATGAVALWMANEASGDKMIRVGGGWVQGASSRGVLEYRDIPYAAAPVGDRRFAAPDPYCTLGRRAPGGDARRQRAVADSKSGRSGCRADDRIGLGRG